MSPVLAVSAEKVRTLEGVYEMAALGNDSGEQKTVRGD